MEEVSPRELVEKLEKSSPSFARGLPQNLDLQDIFIFHVLSTALFKDAVTDGDFTASAEKNALLTCFQRGWLHADKLSDIGRPDESGYFFASPLHQWYVQWKLFDNLQDSRPFETPTILQLLIDVIRKFSTKALVTERIIGPDTTQKPPEAQYQQEFFRCCHAISNGSLVVFPEFGTKDRRVDFYIPSKKWGVELLRNGDQLVQHWGRFSSKGSYATSMDVADYIIVDCRTTYPKKEHRSEISMIDFCHFLLIWFYRPFKPLPCGVLTRLPVRADFEQ